LFSRFLLWKIQPERLHQTPNRPYGRYFYKNFKSNIATLAKRVIHFKELGTGLPGKYRTKLYLDEPPTYPGDQATPRNGEEEEEEIEDGDEVEDTQEIEVQEREAPPIIIRPSIAPTATPATRMSESRKTTTRHCNKLGHSIIVELQDGWLACVIFLKSKYDPNHFTLNISECGRKVLGKKKCPPSVLTAGTIYKQCRWSNDKQTLHISTMQS
jgi:hypothetical protein